MRTKERKWHPLITVLRAKLQPSRARELTPPSQLQDTHRPPSRHMGNKAMEPMDSLLMSAISRLRPLPPTGRLHMQPLTDSLLLVIPLQLPPRHTASLSKDMARVLMTPPLVQSPQRRPLMQLSLHIAPNLPTQPMVSSQQPAVTALTRPQDGNKPAEASQPQSSTEGYNQPSLGYEQRNYSYPQVSGSYPMQPVNAPPSYPPPCYSSSQLTNYNQSSYSQQNTHGQPSSYRQQSSYGQQSNYGQQLPTSYPPQTGSYSQAPSQYSQQSSSYEQQSSFPQDHPSSMGVYGQESGGFSGPGENRSLNGPDKPAGEEGDLIMEA